MNLDENRVVVYKKSKKLGFHGYPENGGIFMVEISNNLETGFLYIAAFDLSSPESLLIKLPDDKAKEIMTQFNNDWDFIASSLQVISKRLVLLNPKYLNSQRRIGTAPTGNTGDEPEK